MKQTKFRKKPLPQKEKAKIEATTKATELIPKGVSTRRTFDIEDWKPKTSLGKQVKATKITNINQILDKGERILEPGIVDALIPELESDLIAIGQSKGKFGGGKASIWRQTQKKTKEGSKASFTTMAVIGNRNGYVGISTGKARETVPAREKATRKAKLNIIKISRGCGSWECGCREPHSIPFDVEGKSGSVIIRLKTAPKGTGLIVEKECKKILEFAGIKDIYSKSFGHTTTKTNLVKACFDALKKLTKTKVPEQYLKKSGFIEGEI